MASMGDKDYYEILGVNHDASSEEIRKAFQKKARTLHPDVNKAPDAEEKFKELSEAYAVLSDADKRAHYDAMRRGGYVPGMGNTPGGSNPYAGNPFGGFYGGFPFDFTPNWQQTRTTRARSFNPKDGATLYYQLTISQDLAKGGVKRGITYQRYVACEHCNGKGTQSATTSSTCPTCHGSGTLDIDLNSIFGMSMFQVTCPECEGTGKVVVEPCEYCGGTGRSLVATELMVDVPAHSHDGDEIKIAGKGHAGTNGRAAGDLIVRLVVPEEHLSDIQTRGFNWIGTALPFIVLGLITNTFIGVMLPVAICLALGVYFVSRDTIKFNVSWLKNAGKAMGRGAYSSLFIALLLVLMMSCTTNYGRMYIL